MVRLSKAPACYQETNCFTYLTVSPFSPPSPVRAGIPTAAAQFFYSFPPSFSSFCASITSNFQSNNLSTSTMSLVGWFVLFFYSFFLLNDTSMLLLLYMCYGSDVKKRIADAVLDKQVNMGCHLILILDFLCYLLISCLMVSFSERGSRNPKKLKKEKFILVNTIARGKDGSVSAYWSEEHITHFKLCVNELIQLVMMNPLPDKSNLWLH